MYKMIMQAHAAIMILIQSPSCRHVSIERWDDKLSGNTYSLALCGRAASEKWHTIGL